MPTLHCVGIGYGDCISCKLQGESYNIESVADDCPYKDKFNKLKK